MPKLIVIDKTEINEREIDKATTNCDLTSINKQLPNIQRKDFCGSEMRTAKAYTKLFK